MTRQTFGVKFSRGRSCTGRCSFLASTNKIAHLLVGLVVHTLVTNYTPVVGSVPPESNMTPLTRQVYTILGPASCALLGMHGGSRKGCVCALGRLRHGTESPSCCVELLCTPAVDASFA